MTRPLTHVARLLRWGRTLARHGALQDLERAPGMPPDLKRLFRLARFGLRQPPRPDYAGAFRAIGPAAIKLGQALATRPDLVGVETARDLLSLQDSLPPLPFPAIQAAIEAEFGRPVSDLYRAIDPAAVGAASVAQVHRAVTTEGRDVAVKVLRPGIEARFAEAISTYEWAAAQIDAYAGSEARRLRPRHVIANFRVWTERELDLRREAASASELTQAMGGTSGFHVPAIDWDRTGRRVLTLDWLDGIKAGDRPALVAAGHDLPALARTLVLSFLDQAIRQGFFHADLHHGNLFVLPDGRIAAIDFGIMGRLHVQARHWLAEILYGLINGRYERVAAIHFEAGYVPAHLDPADFATALRAIGEQVRGRPVSEISVGQMLDGLFAITRDFEMQVQPHLLLLQKTLVMVEGVATHLDPQINMWDVAEPFIRSWMRDELGPEARLAAAIHRGARTLGLLPDLVRRADIAVPRPGAAPPGPPLPAVEVWRPLRGWRRGLIALVSVGVGVAGTIALS